MIAVVTFFQFCHNLVVSDAELLADIVYMSAHLSAYLVFRYAADGGKRLVHTYILDIVQLAEYAELREFCDAGEEDESQIWVASL